MSSRALLRANVSRGALAVDKNSEVITGFSVIQAGEALGHGIEIDETTLAQVIEQGNALENGLKSRFGHPNMSNEALGTFLGRAKDFRLSDEGNRVLADLHVSKTAHETPNGDLATYVINLAAEDPRAFGTSIVFEVETETRLDDEGDPLKDEEGNKLLPLARVKNLFSVDAVDEPAANEDGFLGHKFFGADVKLSAEATGFLNKFLEAPDCVDKARAFLDRYELNKSAVPDLTLKASHDIVTSKWSWQSGLEIPDRKDLIAMNGFVKLKEEEEMTQKEFLDEYPEATKEIENVAFDEGVKLGAETERARIKAVQEQGESLAGHSELIETLKFDGKTTASEAAVKMLAAEKSKMTSLSTNISDDAAFKVPTQEPEDTTSTEGLSVEERCDKEWKAKKHIREEFGRLEIYKAWARADENGLVKTLKGGK